MIDINRNNYEEYFIDYLDGKFSRSDNDMFLLFLAQNPDLKEELEMFQKEELVSGEIVFDRKESLKKKRILDTGNNFDELCIARLEGDLSEKESSEFDNYVAENSDREKVYSIYKKTKLNTDKSVVFKEKDNLKKEAGKISRTHIYSIISAAASVIILIGLYFVISQKAIINNEIRVAEQSGREIKPENSEKDIPNSTAETAIELKKITVSKIEDKKWITEEKVKPAIQINTIKKPEETDKFRTAPVPEKLNGANIAYYNKEITYPQLAEVSLMEAPDIQEPEQPENYYTLKTFLASTFNRHLLNKKEKDKIEFFDIAQAGVAGLNKLTGSNMKLERKLDKNGNPDKTEFNSRLIAFSAPIKKN